MFAIGSFFMSIVWALAITIFILVILHLLMKSLFPSCSLNPATVVVLFLVAIIMFWQSVRMVGAFYIKGYVEDVSQIVSGITENGKQLMDQKAYTPADLKEIKQALIRQYPFVEKYVDRIEPNMLNGNGLVDSVQSLVHKQLNRYIWSRIGWMSVCFIVAFGALYYIYSRPASKKKKAPARRRDYDWD